MLKPNPSNRTNGKRLPKEKNDEVRKLLLDGQGVNEVSRQTGISKPTVIGIRRDMDANGEFNFGSWKKQTTNTLSQIVSRGSTRLLEEIDNIPAGQLPLTIAILVDKVQALQDAPTVVVEHRLRVSHDDINQMIKGEAIDITPPPA